MTKLKVTVLVKPGEEEWYLQELEELCRDSTPSIRILADVTIYEDDGKLDFFFEPHNLTDSVDYVMGHAATLLEGERLEPKEVE